jgi:hypothetical protein
MNRSSDLHRAFEAAPVQGGIQRRAFDSKLCRTGSDGAVKRAGNLHCDGYRFVVGANHPGFPARTIPRLFSALARWADRFDRELSDIFAVQDEVTRRIVDALKIKLSPGESARLAEAPPSPG